jgi:hypothetical protein
MVSHWSLLIGKADEKGKTPKSGDFGIHYLMFQASRIGPEVLQMFVIIFNYLHTERVVGIGDYIFCKNRTS